MDAYNKKYGTTYDAKSFFIEVYYPLFFGNSKYLQWTQNSPFVQGLVSSKTGESGTLLEGKDGKSLTFSNEEAAQKYIKDNQISNNDIIEIKKEKNKAQYKVIRRLKADDFQFMLNTFINKVENCKTPDASIAPGYPASEEKEFATTSGQVSNLDISISKADIYLSWIGSSLSIGMTGGYLLLSHQDILLDLFEGWRQYRISLNETVKLKGNQVNAWNGQWLYHRYDKCFNQDQPMAGFMPYTSTTDGMSVTNLSWTKILIKIAQRFNNIKLLGYFYGFDTIRKLPTTFGFIPINLEKIKRPVELYQRYFGMKDNEDNKAENLWGTEYGLKGSCKLGVIGVKAMQPEGLTQYMVADKGKDVKLPKYDGKQIINFHIYQIWLLAMLNNEELWTKSMEFAKALQSFVNKDKNLSTKRRNQVKDILSSTSKKSFLLALSEIAPDIESFNTIEENAKVIHMMPTDNVPYFLALIRFHYAGLSNKNNQK